jgi:hypothetical protein
LQNFNVKNKSKNAVFSLSFILFLALTMVMAFAPPSSAQIGIPMPEKTVGYASVAPKLVGVGQTATVNLWVFPIPTNYKGSPYFLGFTGVTVTFVKPDGTKDTFMPVSGTGMYVAGETEALGALYFYYKPDMAGNWSVSFTMPAQNLTDTTGTAPFGSVLYQGCTSNSAYFTVQTEPVMAGLLNGYPWAELPNSNAYWSYPINDNNREWAAISGDWLGTTTTTSTVNNPTCRYWQPYGSGPNTAHIIWDQPWKEGGIIGGQFDSYSYVVRVNGMLIMQGKLFMNIPNTNQFQCIEQATGKVIYTANGSVSYGIHTPGNAYSQSSAGNLVLLESSYGSNYVPYLYGTSGSTWNYYDPYTGALVRSIYNCSTARLIDGTMLGYGTASGNLFRWNMTKVSTTGTAANNWSQGIEWQTKLPVSLIGTNPSMFGVSTDQSTIVLRAIHQFWGYSTKDGTLLWNTTLAYPITSNEELPLYGVEDFIVYDATAGAFRGYSMLTGAELWTTSPSLSSSPWATTYTIYNSMTNDYENLYVMLPDGTMAAYSLKDGKQVWRSTAIPSTEYTNNVVPFVMAGTVMVDGKIYCYAGYSTGYQLNPVPRFAMLVCVNATNGNILYTLNGGVAPLAAANGYVMGYGIYDGKYYCLGKGPTITTVTAQQQVGGSVLIQGSILDKSPASSSATLTAMCPNGVPAISDDDMSVWMDYLHMQNATLLNNPPICTGVPVTLTAVDPNGNVNVIGTATSNYLGNFNFQWTPTTPGLYTVYATFAGSNSYYSSLASTGAIVGAAATTTVSPTSTSLGIDVVNNNLMMGLAAATIAIIIAIAIGILLLLRRKP